MNPDSEVKLSLKDSMAPPYSMRQAHRIAIGLVMVALVSIAGCDDRRGRAVSSPDGKSPTPLDLDGRPVHPLQDATARATVLIFVQTDCPISNRYAPEVKRLHDRFSSQNVAFHLIYPDPTQTAEMIRSHLQHYRYPCAAIRDPYHILVARAGVTVTPEAAVFVGNELVYRGRIDDRFIDLGKARIVPAQRDLESVLERVIKGETIQFQTTVAIGCYIPDLSP